MASLFQHSDLRMELVAGAEHCLLLALASRREEMPAPKNNKVMRGNSAKECPENLLYLMHLQALHLVRTHHGYAAIASNHHVLKSALPLLPHWLACRFCYTSHGGTSRQRHTNNGLLSTRQPLISYIIRHSRSSDGPGPGRFLQRRAALITTTVREEHLTHITWVRAACK